MKKKKKKAKEKLRFYRTVKISLKSILKDYKTVQPIINDYVLTANKLVIKTYQFLRLYYLSKYHQNKDIPEINDTFILYCLKTLGKKNDNRGRQNKKDKELKKELKEFYEKEYKPLTNGEQECYSNMTFILPYLATQINTGISNNLKEHFITRLRRYIHLQFGSEFDKQIKECKDKETKKELRKDKWKVINGIVSDLITNSLDESKEEYHRWINNNRNKLVPITLKENNVVYDVECNPSKYIKYSFYINEEIEKMNEQIVKEAEKNNVKPKTKKLFQPLSLRNSAIPKYITIDTASLIDMFTKRGEKGELLAKVKKNGDYIWQRLFKLEKKVFRQNKDFTFNHTISTNGVSVSILFAHKTIKQLSWGKKKKYEDISQEDNWQSLTDLTEKEIEKLKLRNQVGGDPGKSNLIYLNDGENTLTYTACQRRFETTGKSSSKVIYNERVKNKIDKLEYELSNYCCKTVNYKKFKEFLKKKNEVNQKIFKFYEKELFRKLRWRKFTHTQQSEDRFLNKIEEIFGHPDEIVIAYGNWSRTSQMKGYIPTKGKGMRRLIARRFLTITTDEYCTSKICYNCHNETENIKSIHRLLSCKSKECRVKWNRDVNASLNIMNIMKCHFYERRPEAFTRTN